MKKVICLILFMVCAGCVTVKIPKYLRDEFPYEKKYYASYEDTLNATLEALKNLGWKISDTSHPAVFEQEGLIPGEESKQILIFTNVRQTPLLLSSRYMSLNIYVWSLNKSTDVEIRYFSVTPALFKSIQSYKNDPVVEKIFNRISELLEK
ncbi:MAG: hypothetical protein ABIJ41_05755 [Candidatus Omnitrophota bacterium]